MLVTASFLVPGTNLCTKFETNHGKMELDSLFRCNSLVMGELTDDVIRTCSDTKYSIYKRSPPGERANGAVAFSP